MHKVLTKHNIPWFNDAFATVENSNSSQSLSEFSACADLIVEAGTLNERLMDDHKKIKFIWKIFIHLNFYRVTRWVLAI